MILFHGLIKVSVGFKRSNSIAGITAEGLLPIVNVSLIENTTLDTMYFAGLGLKDEDAHLITKVFLDNRGLKKIVLSHNSFTANAVKDWKKSIARNRNITGLDLTANEIGSAGGAVLVDIITETTNINFLNLRACSIPSTYTQLTDFVKKSNRNIVVELLGN